MPGFRGGSRPGLLLRALIAACLSLLFLAIYFEAEDSRLLRPLELESLDLRFRFRGPLRPGPEVVLVMIDDRTVARVGRWPLPRGLLADALRRLADAGARVIGLDLLLAEASSGLPAPVRRLLWQLRDQIGSEDRRLQERIDQALLADDPDLDLATAISAAGRVVMPYAFVFQGRGANIAGLPPWIRASAYPVYTVEPGTEPHPPGNAQGLLVPTAPLAAVGRASGHVSLQLDLDGTLRFDLPVFSHGGELLPSLPVEMVRSYLDLPHDQLSVRFNRSVGIGPLELPTDARMRHLLDYYGPPGTIETHALIDLLDGSLDPALFRDRIVLLGASVTGAGDQFTTPFAARMPGTEHLATAIDNILHQRSLLRDGRTRLLDLAAIVLLVTLATFLAGRRSVAWSALLSLGLPLGWLALTLAAFAWRGWWLSAVVPAMAALAGAVLVEGLRLAHEQARRQRLERQQVNLARYFPPPVVERLASADRPIQLDRTQPAAVMFVDIVGFTKLSETMPPDQALALLRQFHGRVEQAVFAHGGMVDKFVGDGALACFGVPDATARAASEALAAAHNLIRALDTWNAERLAGGAAPVEAGIGIHYGPVLMGDIGGERQFQFTVIGDAVNAASRLEPLTRRFATRLIVSQALLDALLPEGREALVRELEPLAPMQLRGRDEVMQLWRLKPAPPTPAPA